ncbi:MAG: DUF2997 domain-containing protein, partial [Leptolyngbya sp. SIO4C5]|nr:DUF2997 domain-containing protein [Leptolyngbya sp. SIO4C5]
LFLDCGCNFSTAAIEEKLGQVLSQQQTSEYYAQAQRQTVEAASEAQVSFSQW